MSATLVMSDGTRRQVPYNKAAEINEIIFGNAKPKNKKQEAFCKQVYDIEFPKSEREQARPEPNDKERDERNGRILTILADDKLKGKELARAVAQELKR